MLVWIIRSRNRMEVMNGSITIIILQIINVVDCFDNDFLNAVQCPSGASIHAQSQLTGRLIIYIGSALEIIRIVHKVQRERIGSRGIWFCSL